jgi:hypothetical protein
MMRLALPFRQEVLVHWLAIGSFGVASFERWLHAAGQIFAGAALSGLSTQGRAQLNDKLYAHLAGSQRTSLFSWEEPWLSTYLPKPPTKILVAGAGSGREVEWLLNCGYQVAAFEPVQKTARLAHRRFSRKECLAYSIGRCEDLSRETSDLAQGLGGLAPFDAVLLGWGCLTHVTPSGERAALFAALRRLCPRGPVLASFWMRDTETSFGAGRAHSLGQRLGTWLAGEPSIAEPGDVFVSHAGTGHAFTASEIEQLGRNAGYLVKWPETMNLPLSFPHSVFFPLPELINF